MKKYFELVPEVAGEWGDNTKADVSVHPPIIEKLHYSFSGWSGDCIVESFPCFIITDAVFHELQNSEVTGFEIAEVEISLSEEFMEMYPNKKLPTWHWLKPAGIAGKDDIVFSDEFTLLVSEKVLNLLQTNGLNHCDVAKYSG